MGRCSSSYSSIVPFLYFLCLCLCKLLLACISSLCCTAVGPRSGRCSTILWSGSHLVLIYLRSPGSRPLLPATLVTYSTCYLFRTTLHIPTSYSKNKSKFSVLVTYLLPILTSPSLSPRCVFPICQKKELTPFPGHSSKACQVKLFHHYNFLCLLKIKSWKPTLQFY